MTPVDITVTGEDFVSINQEADIPVGTELQLQTKSNHPVIIQRKESKPSSEDTNGRVMKGIKNKSSIYQVREGSEEVWLRLDTDNLLSTGRVSAGLVFGGEEPVVNYVARLDGLAQCWDVEGVQSGLLESVDFLEAEFTATEGVNGVYRWLYYLVDTFDNELSISFDNLGRFTVHVNDFNATLYKDGEVTGHRFFSVEAGVPVVLGIEFPQQVTLKVARLGSRYYDNFFGGIVKDLFTNPNGGMVSIPLTNREQGATQIGLSGNVKAIMAGYSSDVWEVYP